MLEKVDLTKSLSKEEYKEVFEPLQWRLNELQRKARSAGIPTIVVFEGWDAAGKGTLINRLASGLDPRGFKVHPISAPNEDERYHPYLWRFWTKLPAKGTMAIFDRSWYGRVLVERVDELTPEEDWRRAYEEIIEFERQLADEGAVIVKFWLHISKKEQKKRFKKLEKNSYLKWKVGKEEWRHHKQYKKYLLAVEEMLEHTSTAFAPWTVIEATNRRWARVKMTETIIDALEEALRRPAPAEPKKAESPEGERVSERKTLLEHIDLSKSMEKDEYSKRLDHLQEDIFQLEHEIYIRRIPVIIAYEGWDAGGKGGNIKRLTNGLDPRGYEVIPIAAPTTEEKAHHYLWRFWKHIPKAGHIVIFDRTWYGRLLVERVEGFCTEAEWQRAYREINEFERQLVSFGCVLVKFWLHISKEEQLRRFEEREKVEHKKWKITKEDWRNREKWDRYKGAVVDMLQRTSTTYAPWTIVEGNCKYYARVKALETVVEAMKNALEGKGA
ncbi:MAG: phosphate--AMP phosphotransferase [Planctomycetes bacterium]|nr:phosphate--AMP phosphotransferase [Planctomycetota bacterium]